MDAWLVCCLLSLLTHTAEGSTEDGWSVHVPPEVRGLAGYPVVLPCTFSHPQHSQHALLRVLWHLGRGPTATELFRCSVRPGHAACEPGPGQDQRYRLEGNPREHDASLRINGAALQDSGRYYCRVEVEGGEHVAFEDKMGTRLRVEAPPKILAVWVEAGHAGGQRALCRAQGSPLPDVQWLGTDRPSESSAPHPLTEGGASAFHSVGVLRGVEAGQRYTCSATNPLGREQAALYVLPPPGPPPPPAMGGASAQLLLLLLAVAVGAKVVLLVGVCVWMLRGATLPPTGGCWR